MKKWFERLIEKMLFSETKAYIVQEEDSVSSSMCFIQEQLLKKAHAHDSESTSVHGYALLKATKE